MRRPLFMACLCLVIAITIGKILTGADIGENDVLLPDGSPVRVTGRIDTRTSEEIILNSISVIQNNQQYSYSGKLQCEPENVNIETNTSGLKIGQQVVLEGTFSQFSMAANPGEFDVQAYYAGKGIGGRVRKARILATGEKYSYLKEALYRCRILLHGRLAEVFPAKEASVMQTLLLGEKEELDSDVKMLYQKNGIAHILSISGLHITLLGMGLYQLLKRLGVPVKAAAVIGGMALVAYGIMVGMSVSASRAIGMYLLRMLGVLVGRTYDMLTGVGLLALLLVLQEPERLSDVSFLMSFGAVLGICVLTPTFVGKGEGSDSAYDRNRHREGWQKALYEGIRRVVSAVKSGFAASAGVILFTMPIQLWFFYEIPVYSVLLNLLVLPFMSVVMAGGILSLIPGLGFVGTVDCLILWWYEWICGRFGELPGALWCVGRPVVWQVVCYYAGIFLLVFGRKYTEAWMRRNDHTMKAVRGTGQSSERDRGKETYPEIHSGRAWAGGESVLKKVRGIWQQLICGNRVLRHIPTVIILGLSIGLLTANFDRGSQVTFLDVGQGDGIVVETPQGAYLFDCGSTSRKNIGEYVLKPYLKSRGIRSLRGVFVSHPDEDHMNGVIELLENGADWGITVEQVFLPAIAEGERGEAFDKLLAVSGHAGVSVSYIKCGDEIRERGLRLLCLHPEENTTLTDANAYSECFYMEVYAGLASDENDRKISILLTGDVEGEGEQQVTQELQALQNSSGQEFKVDILKVAHHGSGYSTSSEFLTAAAPTTAIISCGRNNTYGHPHAVTLQRLEDAEVPWYGTMDYGAVIVTVDSRGSRLRGYLRRE